MATTSYAIAIGSNQRTRHGSPRETVAAAIGALGPVALVGPVVDTAPIGPSQRRFANTVVIVESGIEPPAMLARLKAIERAFGRRRGQRWAARPIDLDLIWWSGGPWASPGLIVPHTAFRERDFVLRPLAAIVPKVRDPVSGLTMRQLAARLRSGRHG